MRGKFEKFAADKGWNLQRFKEGRWPGEYADGSVQCAWLAWERAIAENQPPPKIEYDDLLAILKQGLPYYTAEDRDSFIYIAQLSDVERTAREIVRAIAESQQENLCGTANADISTSADTHHTAMPADDSRGLLSKPQRIVTVVNASDLEAVLNEPEPNVEVMRDGSCRELGDGEPSSAPTNWIDEIAHASSSDELGKIVNKHFGSPEPRSLDSLMGEFCETEVISRTGVKEALIFAQFVRQRDAESGAAQEVSPVGYVAEIRPRPDAPSCDVCGAEMVWASGIPAWKCLSCGKTKRVEEVSPPRPDWAENWAKDFHDTCERAAPKFDYQTRQDSAVPWAEVPENNRKLMIAVCAEVLCRFEKWRGDTRELKSALAIFVQRGKMRIRELETMKVPHFGQGQAGELAVWRLVRDELEKL